MLLTTSAIVILGCATPNAVVYSPVNAPPRAFVRRTPATVDMFVGKPPTRPHVDVGMFEVYQGRRDDGSGLSTEEMFGTLRLHAALRGCDAVQVMGVELAGRHEWRVVRGVCEMYTDPEAIEADKTLRAERIPGEGKRCTPVPTDTALPPSTSAAPSDALTGCVYPLVCAGNGVCVSPYR
jgi:hypothetical protein